MDLIRGENLDGVEVAYQTTDIPPGEVFTLTTQFEPEKSEPAETF